MNDSPNLLDLNREELIALIEEKQEAGVKIAFSGKANARRLARLVRPRVLKGVKELAAGDAEAQSRNLVIEGDNLQAMVTLYRERGQVDLILTDPPYNTGNDFRYNDRWDEDPNDPGLGEFVSEEDTARHTKWMRFMYPRLKMMKSMLKPTGVLAICIDHREMFHLGQMLDELFDEKNRVAIINWERSSTKRNDKGGVSTATEYVLVYAKDIERVKTGRVDRTEAQDAGYKNPDNDPEGPWYGAAPDAPGRTTHLGMYYGIQSPFTGKLHYPSGTKHWSNDKPTVRRMLEGWGTTYSEADIGDGNPSALLLHGAGNPLEGEPSEDPVVVSARVAALETREHGVWPQIVFTKSGNGKPRKKVHLEKLKKGVVPSTYWADEDYYEPVDIGCTSWDGEESGTSEAGSRELNAVLGTNHNFETVKPIKLFQKIVQLWCPPNGLVIDPFAGSGTTGHAILAQNQVAGTDRRFICIEQGRPEKGDSYARTLTAERLTRVVTGKWASGTGKPIPGGYRFVSLDKKVDAEALLQMEREEMVDTVIASYYDTSRKRGSSSLVTMASPENKYLVARNGDSEGFFLVWEGAGGNTDFNEDVYEACSKEAAQAGLKSIYHVYARYNLFQTENVRFYQIPDRILVDFGLDLRNDSYNEEDAT